MGVNATNWNKIKKEYVADVRATSTTLAKKYGVSASSVQKHMVKEGWQNLRSEAQNAGELKLLDNISDELAETNQKHASTYRQAQAYINRRLQLSIAKASKLENEATEHVMIGSTRIPVVNDGKLMSPQQVMFLMNAMKVAVDGERVALGLPTNVTKSENDVNINDPFAGYTEDQLRRVIEITDAELYRPADEQEDTPEAELTS